MFPLPLFYYFEIGALTTSLFCYHQIRYTPLKWFIPYLVLMICTEFLGRFITKELGQANSWLFNLSIPIEYLFFGFLIGNLCLSESFKKIIFFICIFFSVYVVINLFFLQGVKNLNTNTLKTGSCLMIFTSALGLIDIFKNDNHISLLNNSLFWISTGVLFFNTGEFLYFFFFDVFLQNKWDRTATVFASINNKLIYVLYTCISIAIVCSRKSVKRA